MGISRWFVALFFISLLTDLGSAQSSAKPKALCGKGVCVLTWQDNAYRTGENLKETALTYDVINENNFGQLCSAAVDGQIFAQPLVVTNVKVGGVEYGRVVYVATANDTLYAINGTPQSGGVCQVIATLPFLATQGLPTAGQFPVNCDSIGGKQCHTISPGIGILGTPVIGIGATTGTIYLVTQTQDAQTSPQNWYHYLYSVDIQSLTVNSWVQVIPQGQGNGAGAFSQTHIQRPGLLIANCGAGCQNENYVYVAFSMMDGGGTPYPYGAVFGYNAANLSDTNVFYLQTSGGVTGEDGGGIWMSGAAPAFGTDSSGQQWIYLSTGNGVFDLDSGGVDAGDSLLKLNPNGLTIATPSGGYGYLTPVDQYYRSFYSPSCTTKSGDLDFGSGGVTLIPDKRLRNWPYLAVAGSKEGGLWFSDRTNLGGFDEACGNSCTCTPAKSGNNIQTYWTGVPYAGQPLHGGMAFWEYDLVSPFVTYMYAAAGNSQLIRYPLCADPRAKNPIDPTTCVSIPLGSVNLEGQPIIFPYGTTPAISASGSAKDAVVWAIQKPDGSFPQGTTPGILYAFDAVSMKELYDSNECAGDQIAPAIKFSVPTVANGYVYVGAQELQNNVNNGTGTFYIFGPLSRMCGFWLPSSKEVAAARR
jgi:hypothetical protein